VQRPGVVDIDGCGRDLEDRVPVLETQQVLVSPVAEPSVLGQAVASDSRARENDVAVGGPHADGLDNLDQVHTVALGEQAPLVQKGQGRGAIGILDDLGGFRLDGPNHDGQGIVAGVEHLVQDPRCSQHKPARSP